MDRLCLNCHNFTEFKKKDEKREMKEEFPMRTTLIEYWECSKCHNIIKLEFEEGEVDRRNII